LYRETHNAYENLYREGKNRAVHSLPTAFIKLSEESARSCHGLRSLSNVYELYRRTVSVHARRKHDIVKVPEVTSKNMRRNPRAFRMRDSFINLREFSKEDRFKYSTHSNKDGMLNKLVTIFALLRESVPG
jgi:hypothetical protein